MRQIHTVIKEAVEGDDRPVTDLVEAAGIPRATYYRKVDGHGSFTLDELVRIADWLGTTPGALWARTEQVAS